MPFVLDNSVSMHWLRPDNNGDDQAYAKAVLDSMDGIVAWVPSLWYLEAANVTVRSLHLGHINEHQMAAFINRLQGLSISVDAQKTKKAFETFNATLALAQEHGLTAYDAAYLELAIRKRLPLATLDQALATAATNACVGLYLRDRD